MAALTPIEPEEASQIIQAAKKNIATRLDKDTDEKILALFQATPSEPHNHELTVKNDYIAAGHLAGMLARIHADKGKDRLEALVRKCFSKLDIVQQSFIQNHCLPTYLKDENAEQLAKTLMKLTAKPQEEEKKEVVPPKFAWEPLATWEDYQQASFFAGTLDKDFLPPYYEKKQNSLLLIAFIDNLIRNPHDSNLSPEYLRRIQELEPEIGKPARRKEILEAFKASTICNKIPEEEIDSVNELIERVTLFLQQYDDVLKEVPNR
jgi:hypothetical protein